MDSLDLLVSFDWNRLLLKDRAFFKDLASHLMTKWVMLMETEQQTKDVAPHDVGCWTARTSSVNWN